MMSPDLCSNFCDDLLDLYALGRLPDADTAEVEDHLLLCETCRDRLSETDRFIAALRCVAAAFDLPLKTAVRFPHAPALVSLLPFAAFVLATTPAFQAAEKETRSLFEAVLRATGGDARIMANLGPDLGPDLPSAPVPAFHLDY